MSKSNIISCIYCGITLNEEEKKDLCCLGDPTCEECLGYPLKVPMCASCEDKIISEEWDNENIKHL